MMIHNVRHRRKGELVEVTFSVSAETWQDIVRIARRQGMKLDDHLKRELWRLHLDDRLFDREPTPPMDDGLPF